MTTTQKQSVTKRMKMSERAQQQLEVHFPGYPTDYLWQRKANDGYTTVPRTLPLAMQAIDARSKGQPAGHVLFCLWARSPDHPLVTIESPSTFASEAGFEGERAVDTWRRRMRTLQQLQFIDCKAGPSGSFHYVLLTNPNVMMEYMRRDGLIQDGLYARFIDRLADVGGHRDVQTIRERWAAETAAKQKATAEAAAAPTAAPIGDTPPATPRRRVRPATRAGA